MSPTRRLRSPRPSQRGAPAPTVPAVLAWLKAHADPATLAGMARYGLPRTHAVGVPMKALQAYAKSLGTDHALALALWDTGSYEARMLTAFVADPAALTGAQMDRMCRAFDNWGHVDTLCFRLFDRSPRAWDKVRAWMRREPEFEKRAGFALLWALALHDKAATDAQLLVALKDLERAADDERNFVKKAAVMALRAVSLRGAALKREVKAACTRLAGSKHPGARWVGNETLRKL
ncbi:MAG: DNA alkylation repair protein [Deltaproteobacteria bacterium]|nr:DNA alkylation repair protein [Deltaproteobacteria bacterium]